jgi:hypothetical protein
MKVGTIFKYTSEHSAYKNSKVDLALGYSFNQAGSNRSTSDYNSFVVVSDDNGQGYVGFLKSPVNNGIWGLIDKSAPKWNNIYEVIPVTEIMDIPAGFTPHPQWMKKEDREPLIKAMLKNSKQRNDSLIAKFMF